jgi:hydroxymethylpyrimidine pyrophosphatase-like HAD family hydrolase
MQLGSLDTASRDSAHNPEATDVIHLGDMNRDAQAAFLHEHIDSPGMRDTVFHLRGNFHDLLAQIRALELNANDIDGTLTGVGDTRLYAPALEGIREMRSVGIETIGITGRHEHQVHELTDAHGEDGLQEVIGEQGAILIRGKRVEHYMGNDGILAQLAELRTMLGECFGEIAPTENVHFIPTSGGHHRFQYSMDAHNGNTLKITDRAKHERIMGRLHEFVQSHRDAFAQWKLGTSSTGTFELSHIELKKLSALKRRIGEKGVTERQTVFKGDSGNDLDVFAEQSGILKVAVVNPHTKPELIQHAHFATVGVGNALPMFRLIAQTRRRLA